MEITNKEIINALLNEGVIKIKNSKFCVKRIGNLKPNSNTQNLLFCLYGENTPIKIMIDIVINHEGIVPVCIYCGKELELDKLSNYRPISYSHKHCSKENRISSIDYSSSISKRKDTMIEKYGVECLPVSEETKNKRKRTNIEKYGFETASKNNKVKNKILETKYDRYGDSGFNNREKSKKTCLDKYDVDNVSCVFDINSKRKETLNSKYFGIGYGSKEIKQKIEQTNLEKYGVKNAMGNLEVSKSSCLNKKLAYYGEFKFELLSDVVTLHDKYKSNKNETLTSLSEKIGVSRHTISEYFTKYNLPIYNRNVTSGKSKGEVRLFEIVREIVPDTKITLNDRSVLKPKEIDIWIPEFSVGIEYHGSYWHTEDKVGDLHHTKANMAFNRNITLLQFFDFDSEDKIKEIIHQAFYKNNTENNIIDGLIPIGLINKKDMYVT